jgi:dTDP-4-amino-4,6-dideoxygalactose transaminase
MIGGFGDAEVFSFHATKFFNTFEGGAVTTNDDELATKIRLMKNFGFSGYDQVTYIGTNGKMSEISAAMGLTSLESLADFIQTNRQNYQQYQAGLAGVAEIRLLTFDEHEKCNYQYIVVELDESKAGISRDQLVDILHAENVIARRYFHPGCHRMEPYRTCYPDAGLMLPLTERLADCVITLPTGTGVSPRQISDICELIKLVISHGPEVQRRLSRLPM